MCTLLYCHDAYAIFKAFNGQDLNMLICGCNHSSTLARQGEIM